MPRNFETYTYTVYVCFVSIANWSSCKWKRLSHKHKVLYDSVSKHLLMPFFKVEGKSSCERIISLGLLVLLSRIVHCLWKNKRKNLEDTVSIVCYWLSLNVIEILEFLFLFSNGIKIDNRFRVVNESEN